MVEEPKEVEIKITEWTPPGFWTINSKRYEMKLIHIGVYSEYGPSPSRCQII